MPSQSILSPEEKSKVSSSVPKATNKIFTATVARIYYAYPNQNHWSYAGVQGALAFVQDAQGVLSFKLVDLAGTSGVIWEHELYEDLEYFQDRPYFHSFSGDDCMIGVVFADEAEAKVFFKKVDSRKSGATSALKMQKSTKKKSARGGKIDKSMISGPTAGSFKHVAHMGYDAERGFTSTNIDPSWSALLQNLESQGVSQDIIAGNMDFIKSFIKNEQANADGAKKKAPPVPIPRRGHANGTGFVDSHASVPSSQAQFRPPAPNIQHQPPAPTPDHLSNSPQSKPRPHAPIQHPPPAARASPSPQPKLKQSAPAQPPPPPAPSPPTSRVPPAPARSIHGPPSRPTATAPPPRPQSTAPPAPPAPPPPVRPKTAPPLPPTRATQITSSAPPPPPLARSTSGAPPPPPPPPPATSAAPPPPPPPPPPAISAPPPPPPPPPSYMSEEDSQPTPPPLSAMPGGRANLLASIQGKGIHSLKRSGTSDSQSQTASSAPTEVEEPAAGGDITSALAKALLERNKRMGGSDDEDSDDDSWE